MSQFSTFELMNLDFCNCFAFLTVVRAFLIGVYRYVHLKRTRANGYNKVRSVFAWINNESRRKFSLWTLADIFMVVKKSVRLLIFGNIFYLPLISIDHMIYQITSRISFSCFGHIQLLENVLWENVLEPLKTEDGT